MNYKTARRFARAATAGDLLGCGPRTTLDPFLPYLAQRWQDGQHVATVLFSEIRQLGYRGSASTIRRRAANWRTAEPPRPARALLPGPRTLAWLLLRRPSDLYDNEQRLLTQLADRSAELATARRLAQQFLRLVRDRRGQELEEWATAIQTSGPPELRGFLRNLRPDWTAVYAGLTVRWSSGPVEGHVNKLKVIKRQMFGRARFDLLRKRVLLAN